MYRTLRLTMISTHTHTHTRTKQEVYRARETAIPTIKSDTATVRGRQHRDMPDVPTRPTNFMKTPQINTNYYFITIYSSIYIMHEKFELGKKSAYDLYEYLRNMEKKQPPTSLSSTSKRKLISSSPAGLASSIAPGAVAVPCV